MKNKICNGKLCKGKEKDLSEFNKQSSSKDGLFCWCKLCHKDYNKQNKKKQQKQKIEYRKKNKKQIAKRDKKYQDKNKIEISKQKKQYYIEHKEILKQKSKEHRENNLEYYKEYNKKYQQDPEYKAKRNKRQKIRYNTDINFKITITLRNRIWDVLNRKPKNKKTLELLGCSIQELKKHLENQFTSGMNWKNHGKGHNKWNIDHIKPCASFDLSDPKQQEICFHYNNLQVLWSLDNIRKSDKILN